MKSRASIIHLKINLLVSVAVICMPALVSANQGHVLGLEEAEQIALELDPITKGLNASAEGFAQQEQVAWLRAGVSPEPVLVGETGYHPPKLRLRVLYRVPAEHDNAGLFGNLGGTGQNLAQCRGRECCDGKTDNGERKQRLSPHGVDVRQGVGGCYGAVQPGLVDNRGKKVQGLHQHRAVGQRPRTGVVASLGAEQYLGPMYDLWSLGRK